MDSEVYIQVIYIHSYPYPLLFVMHIITSQSAGVLHVPACNHDRPPLPGSTLYVHALYTV